MKSYLPQDVPQVVASGQAKSRGTNEWKARQIMAGTSLRPRPDRASGIPLALATVCLVPILIGAGDPAFADHGEEGEGAPLSRQPADPSPNLLDTLEQLGLGLSAGTQGNEFLDPEVAFILTVEATDESTVVARWEIADAHYLYRDRFQFALRDTPGAVLGATELPPGRVKEDPYFGRMEVFYQGVQARVPVDFSGNETRELNLDVTYQGCADAGICYPPITKTFVVPFAPASGAGMPQ